MIKLSTTKPVTLTKEEGDTILRIAEKAGISIYDKVLKITMVYEDKEVIIDIKDSSRNCK